MTRRRQGFASAIILGIGMWLAVFLWNGWSYHVCGGTYVRWASNLPSATRVPDTLIPGCTPTFRIKMSLVSQIVITAIVGGAGATVMDAIRQRRTER